jgi:hypothetical protein
LECLIAELDDIGGRSFRELAWTAGEESSEEAAAVAALENTCIQLEMPALELIAETECISHLLSDTPAD